MARKGRNLASFNDLANDNIKKNANKKNNANINGNDNGGINSNDSVSVNDNVNNQESNSISGNANDNTNTNINTNNNNQTNQLDYLDKLIEGNVKKTDSGTVLTGIYLQKDLAQLLDRLAKKGGRGAKSRIVNEALRSIFVEKGLL